MDLERGFTPGVVAAVFAATGSSWSSGSGSDSSVSIKTWGVFVLGGCPSCVGMCGMGDRNVDWVRELCWEGFAGSGVLRSEGGGWLDWMILIIWSSCS